MAEETKVTVLNMAGNCLVTPKGCSQCIDGRFAADPGGQARFHTFRDRGFSPCHTNRIGSVKAVNLNDEPCANDVDNEPSFAVTEKTLKRCEGNRAAA
ncbi:MAG: hypothetical protein AAGH57_00560 [Pseudomonadota bacterium]